MIPSPLGADLKEDDQHADPPTSMCYHAGRLTSMTSYLFNAINYPDPPLPFVRLETGQVGVTRLGSGMAACLVDQPDPLRVCEQVYAASQIS